MVYRWEQHRQTCYRLYVEENKSLEEVVEYMRVHHNFTPRCVFPLVSLAVASSEALSAFRTCTACTVYAQGNR